MVSYYRVRAIVPIQIQIQRIPGRIGERHDGLGNVAVVALPDLNLSYSTRQEYGSQVIGQCP